MHPVPVPSPAAGSRRSLLYWAVAGAVVLSGVAVYRALAGPLGTRQVSAALPPESPVPRSGALPKLPQPRLLQGQVLDADSGVPLRGTSIWAGAVQAVTDADGRFSLELAPGSSPATAIVKLPGYERKLLPVTGGESTIKLRPQVVRAAYLTYYGIADRRIRERVLDLAGRTELNAVVIDVKGDRGLIPYRTEVPAAVEAGAVGRSEEH